MHIALIKTGALGDVVRTTAILPGLRRLDPELDLTWITAPGAFDLVSGLPDVARTCRIDDPEDAPWRHRQYHWVISLDDGLEECELASKLSTERLTGGYLDRATNQRLYTPDVEPWFGMGILRTASRGGLDAANELKKLNTRTVADLLYECLGLSLPIGRTSLPVKDSDREKARNWLSSVGFDGIPLLVGMNTGAGGRWRFKSWGVDQTAELARRLHDEKAARIVILGGEAEHERNDEIVRLADRPGVLAGPSGLKLLEFAALIEATNLLVTSDSLALHLAVAVGRPVVSFYGPTSWDEIEIYGHGSKVVTPLSCRCCYLKDCDIRPHCMQSIGVDVMADAVANWLPA